MWMRRMLMMKRGGGGLMMMMVMMMMVMFDKMIRKMKQVSDRNQNKPSQHQTSDGGWGPGGNSKDTEDDEWRGGSIDPG